ncbi:MAG: hypothetical protein NXI31_00755 [bacterium]|nr:hypothetical protein [bacterium]
MKSCLPLVVALLTLSAATTTATAQGPAFPVGDLLAAPPQRAREINSAVVRPAPASLDSPIVRAWYDSSELFLRHVVSGEGHLLACAGTADNDARRAIYGEDSLLEVLAALVPSANGAFRVTRAGPSYFVRARRAPELLEVGLGTIRQAVPPKVTVTLWLERVTTDGAVPLLSAVESVGFGDVAVVGDIEHSTLISDLEVEIAQSAMTSNPVVVEVTRGASALLRARPLPGRHAAVVEVVTRTVAPFEATPMPSANVSGAVDRICSRIDQAGLAFRVDRGAESVHEWAAVDGTSLRLRCRVDWPGDEPTPIAPLLCSPLLREPVLGFRGTRAGEPDEPTEFYSVADFVNEEFEWTADRGEVPVRKLDEAAALYFAGTDGEQLAQRIAVRVDELLTMRQLTLEVHDVAVGGAPASDKPLWRATGPVLVGLPSCFSSGREQSFVRDWDVEVAQSARIPDPKVSLVEDGWFATAKVMPADVHGVRRVELDLDAIVLAELRRRSLVLSPELVGSTRDAKVELPKEEVTLEQPVTRVFSFDTALALDDNGGAELQRVATGFLGAGRALLVRVRVE